MKNKYLGALYLSIASSIWGGMYVISKFVLDYIPPITLIWIRYVIAFLVLFLILKIKDYRNNIKSKVHKKDWGLIIWIAFIGYFVSIAFQLIGTKLSDAHMGSLITASTPSFIVVFARIILKESLTLRKVISLFFATFGVIVVIGWNLQFGSYLLGCIILAGAAITWALLSVYVKLASKSYSSLVITTYAILIALLLTTPFMIWELQNNIILINNMYVLLGVLYIGIVSTSGAFFLWNKGMGIIDAGIGSLFFFFQPIVGSFLGWLLLGETLTLNFFVGGIFIFIGLIIAISKKNSYKET